MRVAKRPTYAIVSNAHEAVVHHIWEGSAMQQGSDERKEKRKYLHAVEPWRLNLGLGRRVAVFVEDEQKPNMRKMVEPVESVLRVEPMEHDLQLRDR